MLNLLLIYSFYNKRFTYILKVEKILQGEKYYERSITSHHNGGWPL
jgi:hypothetical protein